MGLTRNAFKIVRSTNCFHIQLQTTINYKTTINFVSLALCLPCMVEDKEAISHTDRNLQFLHLTTMDMTEDVSHSIKHIVTV